MRRRIGPLEAQLLAYAQLRGRRTLKTGDLVDVLGITPKRERELFSRMARRRLIASVRRGLYLIPSKIPLGGEWSPNEVLALTTLMADRDARYQICGPNAFNRYGFDNQIPTRVYAYNDKVSGERNVGSVSLNLIKVAGERLGETEEVETIEGVTAIYSSRVRSLVDSVHDWARFGTLPQAYEWIRKELRAGRVNSGKLVRTTLRFGNVGTIRRMGVLLEREGVSEYLLGKLERAVPPSEGLAAWIPTREKRGTVSRRWSVVINGG